jgi:hypothetical protein
LPALETFDKIGAAYRILQFVIEMLTGYEEKIGIGPLLIEGGEFVFQVTLLFDLDIFGEFNSVLFQKDFLEVQVFGGIATAQYQPATGDNPPNSSKSMFEHGVQYPGS